MPSPDAIRRDLPWLVNGSLDASERDAAQAAVDASPALQRERDFLAALRDSIKQEQADAPLELGWRRLQRDIRAQRKASVSTRWRALAVAASVLLLVQSLVVWLPRENQDHYRPLSSSAPAASLQVRFVDSATEAAIRQLLREQHLRIIDGPGAAGLYRLSGDGDINASLTVLKQRTDLVEYVQAD